MIILNGHKYRKVKKDRKAYAKLGSVCHNDMVKHLFGGSLEIGDVLISDDGKFFRMASIHPARYNEQLKNGNWSKRSYPAYGLAQFFTKIERIYSMDEVKEMSEAEFDKYIRKAWLQYERSIKNSEDSIPYNEFYSEQKVFYKRTNS